MQNRWRLAIVSAGLLSAGMLAGGQGTPSTTEPSAELKKLDFLEGNWKAAGQSKETPYSSAAPLSSEANCAWSPNHGYMICDQMVERRDGKHNSLSVYTYDPGTKQYKFFGLDKDARPRTVILTWEGNTLTYPGEFDDNGKKVQMRTLNEVVSPEYYTYRTEFSLDDGKTWTVMNEGKSTRVGGKK
jgi:hypothetical protein